MDNKIDKLPLMVQRILSLKKAPFLDVIMFSKGPGSYTVNRSIKALTQDFHWLETQISNLR